MSADGNPRGLLDDVAAAPEGEVRDDSVVVRPSMRAAVERFLTVFSALVAVATPFAVAFAIQQLTGDRADPRPLLFGGFGSIGLLYSVFVPAVVSLAPAVQLAFTRYIFDEEGLREKVQLVSRTERRVRWEKVTALQHRRTLLDRVLGIERLDVVAYGERGATIHLVGLKDAAALRNVVARQMRREATIAHLVAND